MSKINNKIRDLIQKIKGRKKSGQIAEDDATAEFQIPAAENQHLDNGEAPPPRPDSERELVEDATGDYTGSVEEIDLEGSNLSWKDRFHMGSTKLKDKVNRLNFRKFKSMEIPKEENPGAPTKWSKKKWSKEGLLEGAKVRASRVSRVSGVDAQKFKSFHVEVFSPAKRNRIHKAFQLAMIFGAVFIAGKNMALFLKGADTGVADKGLSGKGIDDSKVLTRNDVNQIKNSGIFKTEAAKPTDPIKKPVIAQDEKCKEAKRKSRLPIKLLNTVVLQDSVKSIASVQVRSSSDLQEVREGDKVNGIAKIDFIDRQKIILKNLKDGNCEFIENADKARGSSISVMTPSQSRAFKRRSHKIEGIENEGNNYTIEKSFIQDKMKNISDILTQARGIQLTNPDGSISFKIVDVEPGGVFSYLGIQNNDVITQINGKKIQNLNEVMSLFGKISNVDKMKITVNRNGEEVPLDYNIR